MSPPQHAEACTCREDALPASSAWASRKWACVADGGCASRYLVFMTAKEQLWQAVEGLSEAEAQDTLGFIVRRRGNRDALADLLERAPLDEEATTLEEEEGVREAKEQIGRGDVLSADEVRREVA